MLGLGDDGDGDAEELPSFVLTAVTCLVGVAEATSDGVVTGLDALPVGTFWTCVSAVAAARDFGVDERPARPTETDTAATQSTNTTPAHKARPGRFRLRLLPR